MRFPIIQSCLLAAAAAQAPSSLYKITNPTLAQALQVHQHFEVLGSCCGAVAVGQAIEFVVSPNQQGLVRALVPTAQWVADSQPFATVYNQMLAAAGPDMPPVGYYTVAEVEAEIDAQVALYPGLARKVDLSALPGGAVTHDGHSIYALKVSDNVAADEDEPAIVIAAQHHARELNSPHMVIGAMGRLLAAYATDPQLQAVVDGYEVYFVPMVNPDGVDHCWNVNQWWRKNRRDNGDGTYGVDLNRNFNFLWGLCGTSTSTNSSIYLGPAPNSEPETQTMRNLVAWLRPEIYLDFHSAGQEVLRTYAPCATVDAAIAGLIERYVDDLRAPMTYAKRDPSASGEAPEDHWSHGTMSFLIEIGTTFQPPFGDTVTEEARVWPGVEHTLKNWRPALRGHVRSSLGSAPLAATITYTPNVFHHGEVCESRARDGRYGLWLPLGSWDVTFAAPGHESRTFPVSVTTYDQTTPFDVTLEASGSMANIVKNGAGNLGSTVVFTYTSTGDAGSGAFFGWSLGTAPGVDLGGNRIVPMNYDAFMQASVAGTPFLAPSWTVLNGADQAQCALLVPNVPWLVGLTTYVNGWTLDPAYQAGVKTWSQPVSVTIIP